LGEKKKNGKGDNPLGGRKGGGPPEAMGGNPEKRNNTNHGKKKKIFRSRGGETYLAKRETQKGKGERPKNC